MMCGPFRDMADDLSIDELRQLVIKRHKAVSQKVSRTRRINGAELTGTKYDPRRDRAKIKKYTRRQLESTLSEYNAFTSRSNQFVGDRQRRPIAMTQWDKYKAAQTVMNNRSNERFDKFGDTVVPGRNLNARQYRKQTKSEFPGSANPVNNDPYPQYDRKPYNVENAKALKKLTDDLKKRASDRDFYNRLKVSRETANQWLDRIGDEQMKSKLAGLSTKQFEWLWNVSPFAKSLKLRYGASESQDTQSQGRYIDDIADQQVSPMNDFINAARDIK